MNRLPSTAERTTSSLSRGFQASNYPIGLSGATIVGPAQGRACGVEQETSPRPHLQKIENFSVKTRPAAAQMSTTNRCVQEEILWADT